MQIKRFFTKPNNDPLAEIKFTSRTSRITKLDGTVVFEAKDIIAPESWSQVAVDIIAQKYFRKKGIDIEDNGEYDARQVFHRLAGCWQYWGEENNYFDSKEDAQIFYDEIVYMLAKQMCAPNSPQWFNTGLHWAYNISGPAQGHSYIDNKTGELKHSTSAYQRPQPHACFIQSIEDNLVNKGGIIDLLVREARIFKYGSGTGTNFSKIRGKYEALSGGGNSSGLMSFLSVGDRAAGAIKSGGTTRRAAKMVCVDIDHPDIEEFINWKVHEEHKVAMLAAGSVLLNKHWNSMCKAVEDCPNHDCNPKTNNLLHNAIVKAKNDGIATAFISQCIQRLSNNDYDRNIKNYTTDWDSEAYATVSGMNSNNSIRVPNTFMQALECDDNWHLIKRTDYSIHKSLKAKDLWQQINYASWACADPGLQFSTTINDWHTCPEAGQINASNPCSEYMFIDDTACNLASLNLCSFLKEDGSFDLPGYMHAIKIWTIVLEISVLMAQFPSDRIAQLSYEFRTLGLGHANLGSMLMRMGIPYNSEVGTQWGAALTSIMTSNAYITSSLMAKELGAFAGYAKSSESMLKVMRNHRRAAYNVQKTEYENLSTIPQGLHGNGIPKDILDTARSSWDTVLELGKKHGFRNAQVTVMAPTGTIGLLMDCDTTGIEPDFSLVKFKKLAGGGYFKLVNKAVPEALKRLGYSKDQIVDIEQYIIGCLKITDKTPGITKSQMISKDWTELEIKELEEQLATAFDPSYVLPMERLKNNFCETDIQQFVDALSGNMTIEGAPHLLDEHLPIFDCANICGKKGKRYIEPMGHIKMMAAIQPFISGAISKTINLPSTTTVGEIAKIHETAWRHMLKAVAIYRDGSKMSQAMATNLDLLDGYDLLTNVDSSINEKIHVVANSMVRSYRKKLPNRRSGYTQAATIGGNKIYLRTGEYEDGTLGEIFLDSHREGAGFRAILNCFAIAVSMGLQSGIPLEEFCNAFLFTKFEPNGMVQGSDTVKFSTSIIDFIFRELAISYLGRFDLAQVEPEQLINLTKIYNSNNKQPFTEEHYNKESHNNKTCQTNNINIHDRITTTAFSEAREKGYTGDPCPECGHLTMIRNGACLKCQTCATTTGCS